jgi:hypothetical protein
MFHQGSRVGRGLKAFVFGTIGAVLGAILYYAIIRITGWNIGLVAVVVGLMIGGAVKAGSGNRGGRFYQFLAVFLTYSAMASFGAFSAPARHRLRSFLPMRDEAGSNVPHQSRANRCHLAIPQCLRIRANPIASSLSFQHHAGRAAAPPAALPIRG